MFPTPPSSNAPFALNLFGAFQAWVAGEPLPRLRSRKGHRLLALLALRHGREVEREWLTATLWPENPPHLAAHSLRNSLADLRRALGSEVDRLSSPTPRTLGLDLAGACVDLLAFDAAVADGRPDALEEAVALARAPLLEGWAEEWAFQERQERELAVLTALETLTARAVETGHPAMAERYLRLAIARDPLREQHHRTLMRLLRESGNAAAALTVYHELRLWLRREVNAEPDPDTQALFEQIRAEARRRSPSPLASGRARHSNSTQQRAPGPAGEGVALARGAPRRESETAHNLPCQLTRFIGRQVEIAAIHELLTTERLITLAGPGGCGKTRLALAVVETYLDRQVCPAAASQPPPDEGTGPPAGCMSDPLRSYPDGVWLVELAALRDSGRVAEAILSAMSLRQTMGDTPASALVQLLRHRRLLLVLDNCEPHVAACAELAEALLQSCPDLQILATSREALGVPGERPYRVPPLSLPPPVEGPGLTARPQAVPSAGPVLAADASAGGQASRLLEYDSVRLFVERATTADPSFRWACINAPAVAAVCRGLEGMPLAIELAAARAGLLSVDQIAAGLQDRLGLLAAGSRTAPPRHRTLRASMDWSHDLLTEPEQILLRRLAVFRDGWALGAALAIASDSGLGAADRAPGQPKIEHRESTIRDVPVLDLLGQLVAKSLVDREGRTGEARLRLLETVAEYAREKLEIAGEAIRMRGRHRDWFLALAEAASERMWGRETAPWHDRVEREAANLRTALEWSLERGEAAAAMRLGAGLVPFWGRRYLLSEGREQLDRLLSLPEASPPTSERALLLRHAGIFLKTLGHHAEARSRYEESLAIYQRLGDEVAVSTVLSDLAELAAIREGDLAAGRAYLEEQTPRCDVLTDPLARAAILQGLTGLAHLEADYQRVRELSEAVIGLRKAADHPEAVEKGLETLGYLIYDLGDHTTALAHFDERVRLLRSRAEAKAIILPHRSPGPEPAERCPGRAIRAFAEEYLHAYPAVADRCRVAGSLMSLGSLVFEQGDCVAARVIWEENLDHFVRSGDQANTALVLGNLAELARCRGEYDAARSRLEECRRIGQEIGQRRTFADAIHRLGLLASDLADWEAAERHFNETRIHYQELGHQWPLLLTLCQQATLARRLGDLARANGLLDDALPRLRQTGRQSGIALALGIRGYVLRDEGDLSQARADLLESLALRRPKADRLGIAICLEGLASIDAAIRQHRQAARQLGAAAALREAVGAPLPPADRKDYDRQYRTIRGALDRDAFAAAWAEGSAAAEACVEDH